ncbi:MAG: DUF3540 domain-containing protein [Myxococcaceae bacterium]|nr:MAG: DUF3540 domain-containing protein [Myxococcaceae bacterium]
MRDLVNDGGAHMTRDDSEAPVAAQESESTGTLTTVTGISASITRSALDAEILRVVDADGRLLFEHNTSTRVTVIVAPEGDLELRAPRGKVKIVAAEGFELDTPTLHAKIGEARVEGRSLSATFERVKSAVGVIETRAERIIERAKNTYREVEELSQTRAGRLRLVAEKTVSLLGQRAVVKAKEDVKIKGDKVYLA